MDKSIKFWDNYSNKYDEKAKKDKAYKMIIERATSYIKSDHEVLDFACAGGLYSFPFASKVKNIQAFDSSSKMIEKAKQEKEKRQVKNIHFSCTNLFDEQFKPGSFDVIFAFNILLYFKDMNTIVQRMYELLKPGGMMITSTACLKEKRSLAALISTTIIKILRWIKFLPSLHFISIKELEDTILNQNFQIQESDTIMNNPATEVFIAAKKI